MANSRLSASTGLGVAAGIWQISLHDDSEGRTLLLYSPCPWHGRPGRGRSCNKRCLGRPSGGPYRPGAICADSAFIAAMRVLYGKGLALGKMWGRCGLAAIDQKRTLGLCSIRKLLGKPWGRAVFVQRYETVSIPRWHGAGPCLWQS